MFGVVTSYMSVIEPPWHCTPWGSAGGSVSQELSIVYLLPRLSAAWEDL